MEEDLEMGRAPDDYAVPGRQDSPCTYLPLCNEQVSTKQISTSPAPLPDTYISDGQAFQPVIECR